MCCNIWGRSFVFFEWAGKGKGKKGRQKKQKKKKKKKNQPTNQPSRSLMCGSSSASSSVVKTSSSSSPAAVVTVTIVGGWVEPPLLLDWPEPTDDVFFDAMRSLADCAGGGGGCFFRSGLEMLLGDEGLPSCRGQRTVNGRGQKKE